MLRLKTVLSHVLKSRQWSLLNSQHISMSADRFSPVASLAHTDRPLRHDAESIFSAGVASVMPHHMVRNALILKGNTLYIGDKSYSVENGIHVVAFGKAVLGMVRAAEDVLGSRIIDGVASVPVGIPQTLKQLGKLDLLPSPSCRVTILEGAADNIPDEAAFKAAQEIYKLLARLGKNDFVLTLISGGGSALLPYPTPPITLEEMAQVTRQLSRKGCTIQQLNTVRKHLEVLKGGGLVRVAHPAKMATLILSDVIGDDLSFIASGPTVPCVVSPRKSIALMEQFNLLAEIPSTVLDVLQSQARAHEVAQHLHNASKFPYDHVQNILVGTNNIALEAAKRHAEGLGYHTVILSSGLSGTVREVAEMFSCLLRFIISLMYGFIPGGSSANSNVTLELKLISCGILKSRINEIRSLVVKSRNTNIPLCVLTGGETTVEVTGQGQGGRNQEMALLLASEMHQLVGMNHVEHLPVFLSAGTDGQDGPTGAAGAVVDSHTIIAAQTQKLSPQAYLDNNDSYTFFTKLKKGNCHIITGLTGTNVMDIQILLLKPNRT